MADFIISPYAISFNSIKNALQSYIENKSDVTTTWKDFYTAGAGQTILELDAAVAAFYAFHFIIGRREAFLSVAQNYSSIIGGALSLGYNASRGFNDRIGITITPTTTQGLSKWTTIGSYAEYDIILMEDTIVNAGESVELKCVIGNSTVQQVQILSKDLQQFVFTSDKCTDDCRLILNNREVPYSTEIKDAMDDKYIMLTNPYGAVDVFYLNNGQYNYTNEDILTLQYIERNNIHYKDISPDNISIDLASQVNEIVLLEKGMDPEDGEHVRLSAPIYHEMNNVVRARKDYVKYLTQNNKFLIDANDKDITPGLIALTYLKQPTETNATSLLTEQEKEQFFNSIMKICPDGVADCFIIDPIKVVRNLSINLYQKSNESIPATIQEDIQALLDNYCTQLQPNIDLTQIEHDIEQLKGVKIARVDLGTQEYHPNTSYKLCDVIEVPRIQVGDELETRQYYCYSVGAKSGGTEPQWAQASKYGDTIFDGTLVWENTNEYADDIPTLWKPTTYFDLWDTIKCSYTIPAYCTGGTEPLWGEKTHVDANVTWNKLKGYDYTLRLRKNDTPYSVGASCLVEDGQNVAIYTVKETLNKSSVKEPTWTIEKIYDEVQDNAISWKYMYNSWIANTPVVAGQKVAYIKGNNVYIYQSLNDEITGTKNPLNGNAQCIETYETTEYIDQLQADGITTIQVPVNRTVKIIWEQVDCYQNVATTWKASSVFALGQYIEKQQKFFQVVSVNNNRTGLDTPFVDSKHNWLTSVSDNNIVWGLDTYIFDGQTNVVAGKYWKPVTQTKTGDKVIVTTPLGSYLYTATYVKEDVKEVDNVIYTVVAHCGTTSTSEPEWGADNVVDNNIVWTKTENPTNNVWSPNKTYRQGYIIKTTEGNYTFATIVGKTGITAPDWAGSIDGRVEDNDLIWKRITNIDPIQLHWNEYLEIKATAPKIMK